MAVTGAIKPSEYLYAGHVAYSAWRTSQGDPSAPMWHSLVWAEQKAWCEAARAVKEIGK